MLRSSGSTRPQQLVFADSLPAFVEVVAARGGGVWVRMAASVSELLASGPTNISSNRWAVFDPDGRWLGTVTSPAGLRIHEIGPDYVMGVWQDELGVQYCSSAQAVQATGPVKAPQAIPGRGCASTPASS